MEGGKERGERGREGGFSNHINSSDFSPLSADGAVRGRDTTAVNSLGRNRFNCCSFSGF